MSAATLLPETVADAISNGVHIVKAFRDYLGYTIDDLSVASGLTVAEIEGIETNSLYDESHLARIARALSQPEMTFTKVA